MATRGALVGLAPPKQSSKPYYKTVLFVQISENVKPHCTNVKPHYRGLSGDGSVATPSFSSALPLVTVARF